MQAQWGLQTSGVQPCNASLVSFPLWLRSNSTLWCIDWWFSSSPLVSTSILESDLGIEAMILLGKMPWDVRISLPYVVVCSIHTLERMRDGHDAKGHNDAIHRSLPVFGDLQLWEPKIHTHCSIHMHDNQKVCFSSYSKGHKPKMCWRGSWYQATESTILTYYCTLHPKGCLLVISLMPLCLFSHTQSVHCVLGARFCGVVHLCLDGQSRNWRSSSGFL